MVELLSLLQPGALAALGLYLVRTSALVLFAPLLGLTAGFSGYKIALIVALTLVLYAATGSPLGAEVSAGDLVLMAMRELLIGLFLAFVLQLALLAMDVAGQLIGHEVGWSMASVVDPISGINTAMLSRFYETFFFLGLLAIDGHHWILRALDSSFERAPVGAITLERGVGDALVGLFGQMFAAGITFAAPVMILLALVSMMMGLLARMVPQLNVLEVGFTLRVAVALLGLFLFAPLLAPAMESVYALFAGGLETALDALEA